MTGAPRAVPSAANRLTVCTLVLREGADVQGRALRELAKAATENSPALGQQAHRNAHSRRKVHAFDDIIAIGTHAQLEIQPIVDPPAVLGEKGEFGTADLGVGQSRGVGRSLGKGAIEPDDIELLAVVFAVEPGLLKVDADLEHVLAQPVILREREALDDLQAAHVALLAVEEIAALSLRGVDHGQRALGFLIDLEGAHRNSRFEDRIRREDQPIDEPRREARLRELRSRLLRAERREGRIRDLAREVDHASSQCVTRRQDRIEPCERVEAVEPDLRLIGQALDLRANEAVLEGTDRATGGRV